MPLPCDFDTAVPYVFSMCNAPGDGWNPPVIAMATFDCRASSVRNGVRWRDYTGKWPDFGRNLAFVTDL